MNILVIGATGYVGSAVARAFRARGDTVHGLSRSAANRAALAAAGIAPVDGDLADLSRFAGLLRPFDVVVWAAMIPFEDEIGVTAALVEACRGPGRALLFTSGTGVLSIEAKDGAWSQWTFAEDDPFPFPERENRRIRMQAEALVRDAAGDGFRTFVIRPPLIFGLGGSIQIPQLFESVRQTGAACYLGDGLNLYSNVHVDDLAALYPLVLEKGVAGALYHAVAGEANFRELATAVARAAGCDTRSLTYAEACDLWGAVWVDLALAVNSRSIARRTVADLGWQPRHRDVVDDIANGSYRESFLKGRDAFSWGGHGSSVHAEEAG